MIDLLLMIQEMNINLIKYVKSQFLTINFDSIIYDVRCVFVIKWK
jgi:hypothetical protein